MKLSKLAIIGPGLLGGSIALAVRKRNPAAQVTLWARRAEAVGQALERKVASRATTDLAEAVSGAELIVFCVPIGAMASLAEQAVAHISPDALVTDVGSVKTSVVRMLSPVFKGRFVGSHPMAGSEQTGLAAARADLFEQAVCIVTPEHDCKLELVKAIGGFWAGLGGDVRTLTPTEHDEIIALVSHLPHALAATLINAVCAQNQNALGFCGNGFRDTTRVASGPAEMWSEILRSNRDPVKKSIEAMIEKLNELVKLLDADDDLPLKQFLQAAKSQRDSLRKQT